MLRPAVVTDRDEAQHDPSARLARLVDVRDLYCCGPGCSSRRTERDHLDPWPNGPTSAANLSLESPRCHHAKHAGWTLVKHPDGSSTWTSPLGRTYTRPSPHAPPPRAELYDDPPPLRERPTPNPAVPERHLTADDLATNSRQRQAEQQRHEQASSADLQDDDPPPF